MHLSVAFVRAGVTFDHFYGINFFKNKFHLITFFFSPFGNTNILEKTNKFIKILSFKKKELIDKKFNASL